MHQNPSSLEEWILKCFGDGRRIDMATMGFHGVPQAIVGTDRIATVQRTLAHYYRRLLAIRILEPELELPTLPEHVQWNRFGDTDPGLS